MKARDILSMVGAFFMAMGSFIINQKVPDWAWWLGNVMIILGPILMASRAVVSAAKDVQKTNEFKTKMRGPSRD